jgi:hypothetical protein
MDFFRGYPAEDTESVEHWLKRTMQTELSIRHFWSPIMMATLNDRLSHCSTRYAGKGWISFVQVDDGVAETFLAGDWTATEWPSMEGGFGVDGWLRGPWWRTRCDLWRLRLRLVG